MRAVVQRVSKASVKVADQITGSIDRGFCVLLGVTHDDDENKAKWLAEKIAGLRVFEDDNDKLNLSLKDVEGSLLVVSQFTLYGDCRKGRRPSFVKAADPSKANELYEYFLKTLRDMGFSVETGVFQTHMDVEIHNDGPVTLIIETPEVK